MMLLLLILSYVSTGASILGGFSYNLTQEPCDNFEDCLRLLCIVMNTLIKKHLGRNGFHITVHHEEKLIQELKKGRNKEERNAAEAMEELNTDWLLMI